MNLTNPITANNLHKSYQKISFSDPKHFDNSETTLFWLCRKEDTSSLSFNTKTINWVTENFISARTRLIRMSENNQKLPDVIIIELPFQQREMKNFIKWLHRSAEFQKIPVIYSKKFLTKSQFSELRVSKLVDDILDFPVHNVILNDKIRFLKNVKLRDTVSNRNLRNSKFLVESIKCDSKCLIKRILDIFIATVLILFLLPVFLIIAFAIRFESKGPVIYSSYRTGKGFKIFKFFKFRTMVVDADQKVEELEKLNLYSFSNSSAKFFKIKDDPRVTKVGSFLRNTSLDELPQLFNVLIGDMSIVGNRPLPLYEANTLTTDEWAERFMAPAGITGLWQIKKRGKLNMTVEERINLDISYARDNSFRKDFWIMLNTPSALVQKTNV
ncbi:MAG: sugar transferase [Terrimonas sp.]|nr:sugar transferase [Terrimonas sp.]